MASRAASATICWAGWKRTDRPRQEARRRAVRAWWRTRRRSRSRVLALRTSTCRPSVRAASCASLCMRADSGSFGFTNIAITAALGTSSCSRPSALPASKLVNQLTPVTLPPGRLRLRHVALLDWVAARREHNRNGLGRRHGSQYRSATSCRGDHGYLAADQVGRKGRQSIVLIFGKTGFDRDVAAIDIAGFTQATAEGGRRLGRSFAVGCSGTRAPALPAVARAPRVATRPSRRQLPR